LKVSLPDYFEQFCHRLRNINPNLVYGMKSIAAYRCGLDALYPLTDTAAFDMSIERELQDWLRRSSLPSHDPPRLTSPAIINCLFNQAMMICAKLRLPMQIHTGYGDRDLDLLKANPAHLRKILEHYCTTNTNTPVSVVLLHAGYPYVRETGFLASLYPHVYADFGMTYSMAGDSVLEELFELAPLGKLMYSSDTVGWVEEVYFSSMWIRRDLGKVS